jgi:hypothetical protein
MRDPFAGRTVRPAAAVRDLENAALPNEDKILAAALATLG